eukprot:TRINITY_DN29124_c0_g1_i1.p1 TRINITY_DN29124_c0_g1~~TRINITY_DN29124_c0_g1_i1.p1  ORF type:complete len:267 (-),score=84.79 TRINITY_DN29124_c0_g1_i1:177-977(-)
MKMSFQSHFIAFLFAGLASGSYVTFPAHRSSSPTANISFVVDTRHDVNGFYFVIDNPMDHFHVYFPQQSDGKCGGRQQTDVQAKAHNCTLAMNGSPFSFSDPTCLGDIVSDGKIVLDEGSEGPTDVDFGLTQDGNFIIGNLQPSDVHSLGFVQLLSAFGWLVQVGVPLPDNNTFIAGRTIIGADKDGRLILFQIDGIEGKKEGVTLAQAATWVADLGGYNVVNLDGGGSSATFYNGKIIDHPTCNDTPTECVRAVTTIVCVRNYAS